MSLTLMNIKTRFGDELVTEIVDEMTDNGEVFFLLRNPVQLVPHGNSVSAREWLYFSRTDEIWLSKKEIIFINEASEEGSVYFEKVMQLRQDYEAATADEPTEEEMRKAEEIVKALLQAQTQIKH